MESELSKLDVIRCATMEVAHLRKNIDRAIMAQMPKTVAVAQTAAFAVPLLLAVCIGVAVRGVVGASIMLGTAALVLAFRNTVWRLVRRPQMVLLPIRREIAPHLQQIANHEDSMRSIARTYDVMERQPTNRHWSEEQKDTLLFELNIGFATAKHYHAKAAVALMRSPRIRKLMDAMPTSRNAAAPR